MKLLILVVVLVVLVVVELGGRMNRHTRLDGANDSHMTQIRTPKPQ